MGSDADIAVVNPDAKTVVRGGELHTNSKYSLYEGWELEGSVEMSLVRGEVILREGKLEQGPGYGQFIPRRGAGARSALG